MQVKIYPCGIKVKTKLSGIEAIITGITIRFAAVAYELSYFKEAEYQQIWVNETEFTAIDGSKIKIGFIK